MKKEITVLTIARQFAAALIAITIVSSTSTSAATAKRGEDPEFKAAWRALVAKEQGTRSANASVRTTRQHGTTLPVAAIGNNPRDICNAVRNRMRYTSDVVNAWQSADQSWNRKKGDCEDFAVTVRHICHAKGLSADVYAFYPKTGEMGHAVTIGRSADGLWMSSNGSFERITSITDARNIIRRRHGWTGTTVASYKAIGRGKQLVDTSLL
jgi:predicted transglutaminase-like cysteine proteinase